MLANLLEPRFIGKIAVIPLVFLYFGISHRYSPQPFHDLELVVLLLALFVSQENYQILFSNLSHIVNDGASLKISASNWFLKLHNVLGLSSITLATLFLALSSSTEAATTISDNSHNRIGILAECYLASLMFLYVIYCYTNKTTLCLLSDALAAKRPMMSDANYSSRMMMEIGNNVLYLKNENVPALIAYMLLLIISSFLIWGPYKVGSTVTRDIAMFNGGAATVHVAISAMRFYFLARDTTKKKETERDAIELLVAHMRPVDGSLATLQVTLRSLGDSWLKGLILWWFLGMGSLALCFSEACGYTHIMDSLSAASAITIDLKSEPAHR